MTTEELKNMTDDELYGLAIETLGTAQNAIGNMADLNPGSLLEVDPSNFTDEELNAMGWIIMVGLAGVKAAAPDEFKKIVMIVNEVSSRYEMMKSEEA